MARIFNTIRQRLLKEDRFMRYLIYAIGEIVLVVIGILIALQINDNSAQQKLERTNVRMMERMQDELHINIDRLHYLDTMYSLTMCASDGRPCWAASIRHSPISPKGWMRTA